MKILALLAVFISLNAHAHTYHRLWRGNKLSSLSSDAFSTGLNMMFIPATVKTGAGNGMIAYQPVLTSGLASLPDEIALVSYESKDAYDALYSTAQGKAYQNLHWQYFDRATSHSVVPQFYAGTMAIEQAYDLHPQYAAWMRKKTTLLITYKKAGESNADFIARANSHAQNALTQDIAAGIHDRVILLTQKYWLEYVSADDVTESQTGADISIPLDNVDQKSAHVSVGHGVNLGF